jgi:hypothetical protein
VEALLDWRNQLDILPITVNYLPGQTEITMSQLHHVKTTKAIAG